MNITTDHPIHELLANRWSPYSFDDRPVSNDDLRSLFEAARWAPSSYNEQPWRFIVATKDESADYERIVSCLVEGNKAWAQHAPVLAIGVIAKIFKRNGKPNTAAEHDLGLAVANLTVEATSRSLCVHQMIGILPDQARDLFGFPNNFVALTGIAIGYIGKGNEVSEEISQRDLKRRLRKPLGEMVFGSKWGQSSDIL